ncbi:ATP-binding protein [Roseibium aquae]|uniref:ATP-binding protein n=1 Tax=Roseibium aquae TaxID=1323746 RepID=A0A916TLY9_9HYPH|nr:cell envelope integrity EipB family protein [Roseibium aquae]GGB58702.1 ATP-binding protein [Roseibium aquae]
MKHFAAVLPLIGMCAFAPVLASAAPASLAPHRAVYDMKLEAASAQAGVTGVVGRMVYDFSGNACDGYSVKFRFVTQFQDPSGASQVTDLRTTSYEDGKARSFEFLSETYVNNKLIEETRGAARQAAQTKTVELAKPESRALEISGNALFPTEHLRFIISAALKGERFVAADVFDGSETGDKVYPTTAFIGAPRSGVVAEGERMALAALAGADYWPVTIAYFEPADGTSGEQTPAYQLSFLLHENGVSHDLTLDYGDFKLSGELQELEFYDVGGCGEK